MAIIQRSLLVAACIAVAACDFASGYEEAALDAIVASSGETGTMPTSFSAPPELTDEQRRAFASMGYVTWRALPDSTVAGLQPDPAADTMIVERSTSRESGRETVLYSLTMAIRNQPRQVRIVLDTREGTHSVHVEPRAAQPEV